jgi:capsid portal protein
MKLYSPRSPYGLPRFIGNLLSIFGDRAAEEINWVTFKNNNIPSMAIAVSNGQLTQGTIDRIQSFVESQIQGSDNYSKFLIIEAEPSGEDTGEDGGQVKIDIRPLTKEQHTDALFQTYSNNNHDKIRRAFRLPPIFVGQAADYSRSTAESSRRLADEQVFGPERTEFDEVVNRLLFPEMGVIYHKFKSNTPNTTDNTQLVKILGGSEKTGGMTPRIARFMLEDILGIDLPDFAPKFPADIPFSLTMAEAVKNQAQPTEPGQQVTALKALGLVTDDGEVDLSELGLEDLDEDDPESVMEVAKRLLALNRAAEITWRKQVEAGK